MCRSKTSNCRLRRPDPSPTQASRTRWGSSYPHPELRHSTRHHGGPRRASGIELRTSKCLRMRDSQCQDSMGSLYFDVVLCNLNAAKSIDVPSSSYLKRTTKPASMLLLMSNMEFVPIGSLEFEKMQFKRCWSFNVHQSRQPSLRPQQTTSQGVLTPQPQRTSPLSAACRLVNE